MTGHDDGGAIGELPEHGRTRGDGDVLFLVPRVPVVQALDLDLVVDDVGDEDQGVADLEDRMVDPEARRRPQPKPRRRLVPRCFSQQPRRRDPSRGT